MCSQGAKEIEDEDAKEVEWHIDTSEEAIRARAQELPDDLKRALVIEDDEDGEGAPLRRDAAPVPDVRGRRRHVHVLVALPPRV